VLQFTSIRVLYVLLTPTASHPGARPPAATVVLLTGAGADGAYRWQSQSDVRSPNRATAVPDFNDGSISLGGTPDSL